jgi:hypothetical protein
MARTILRSRSGGIVTTVQLADRTGIVAASAPPAVEESASQYGPPSTLVASVEPHRPTTRRVRRNLLFTCAAALFLVVGWVGGGTIGDHDTDTPAVAAGAVIDQDQAGAPRVPSHPAPAIEALKPPNTPAVDPQGDAKTEVAPTTKKADKKAIEPSTGNTSGQSRSTQADTTTAAVLSPMDAMSAQVQQLISAWANSQGYRGYGETPQGFGR